MQITLLRKLLPLMLALTTVVAVSCYEDNTCYDKKLFHEHKGDICPENCPGFEGCDGIFYCNECIANRAGIKGKG